MGKGTVSVADQVSPQSSEYLPCIMPQRCFLRVVSWFQRQYRRPLLLNIGCCQAATGLGSARVGEPAMIFGSVQVRPPSALREKTTCSSFAVSKEPCVQKAYSRPRAGSSSTWKWSLKLSPTLLPSRPESVFGCFGT